MHSSKLKFSRILSIKNSNSVFYCTAALSAFNKIYGLQNILEPLPFRWNPHSNSFQKQKYEHRNFRLSSFIVYFIMVFIVMGSALDVIINRNEVDAAVVMISVFVSASAIVMVSSYTTLVFRLEDVLCGFRQLSSFIKKLSESTREFLLESVPVRGPFGIECGLNLWSRVAISLIFSEITFASFVVVCTTAGVYLCLDTFQITIPKIFPSIHQIPWLLTALRVTICFVSMGEASRFYSIYIPMLVFYIEMKYTCLMELGRIPIFNHNFFFTNYGAYEIADNCFQGSIFELYGVLMGCGFVMFAVANVATLKCYRVVHIFVYLMFPATCVLLLLFTFLLVSFAVYISRGSHTLLKQRERQFQLNYFPLKLTSIDRKVDRIKYKSARIVTMNCGNFYPLEKGAESDFFFYILLRTLDTLLVTTQLRMFRK